MGLLYPIEGSGPSLGPGPLGLAAALAGRPPHLHRHSLVPIVAPEGVAGQRLGKAPTLFLSL